MGRPEGRSVLVAVEEIATAAEVIRSAADLALAASATLHLVHAVEGTGGVPGTAPDLLTDQRELHERRLALHALVDEVLPPLARVGALRVDAGRASEIILQEARDLEVDLIVLGAHRRRRGIADRFLGSTAEEVLRGSVVPCLLLNRPLELPIRTSVVAHDFSSAAEHALGAAVEWGAILGRQGEAKLLISHIHTGGTDAELWPGVHDSITARLRTRALEVSESLEEALSIGIEVRRHPRAADSLLAIAAEADAGLLILGTQGERVLTRALLGSITSALIRSAPVPMLIIPPAPVPARKPEWGAWEYAATGDRSVA